MPLNLPNMSGVLSLLPGKQYVGIDLGKTHIKVAGIRLNQRKATLEFYKVVDLVETYSIPELQDIRHEHYTEQLHLLSKEFKLGKALLNSALPADSTVIHTITLPNDQTDEELIATIQQELGQVSVQPLDEMQIACHNLSDESETKGNISLLSCAVSNQTVQGHRDLLEACRLNPGVIDVDAFGLYNALFYFINKNLASPLTAVHVGASHTICLIMLPYQTPFFYVIAMGGNDVTKAIMQEVGMPFHKAENFKKKMQRLNWTNRSHFKESRLSQIYSGFANGLLTEVRKCVRHYQTHRGITDMTSVLFTGGSAKLPYLLEKAEKYLSFPARIWNPLTHFRPDPEDGKKPPDELGLHLPVVLGTLLRGD